MNVKHLGITQYQDIWSRMKDFTASRTEHTEDEIWMLEHYPVYTQGQAGKQEHILNQTDIPIIQSDRGGQVTYHGPGQMIAYVLLDINRRHLGVRTLVSLLEQTLIDLLQHYHIEAQTQCGAPGVYVNGQKIASIGLRVKQGRTYHGIALNVNMDLSPFLNINPCGFSSMTMTQISHFYPDVSMEDVCDHFLLDLCNKI